MGTFESVVRLEPIDAEMLLTHVTQEEILEYVVEMLRTSGQENVYTSPMHVKAALAVSHTTFRTAMRDQARLRKLKHTIAETLL